VDDLRTLLTAILQLGLVTASVFAEVPTHADRPRDYTAHLAALERQIPGAGFHIVLQPPFVVVGDEAESVVRQRATGTIQWAVDRLKKEYFDRDPAPIITIWLFRDKTSYQRNVKKIWGETPTTPFGYYSARHRALVMNIATGGGTLVHEIVHPFVESNFPNCPAWFNEGLGSLYEQCSDHNGRIWGATNWRLAGLQRAIRAGKLPSLKRLCSTTSTAFYADDRGTNYAQARYLCYYLQQQGLLQKFYRQFRASSTGDPTGYETLQRVLGESDMAAFQKRWETFVLGLRFPT
jgi:hypothetical protein